MALPISKTRLAPIDRARISRRVPTAGPTIGTSCSAAYSSISPITRGRAGRRPRTYSSRAMGTMSVTSQFYNLPMPLPDGFPTEEFERLVATRRDLHRHPETAYEERRTAGIAAVRLRELGLSPRERVGNTGVVGDLGHGGPRVMYRADMDALPLTENSSEPYASTIPGRMHACGHDGHVAIA